MNRKDRADRFAARGKNYYHIIDTYSELCQDIESIRLRLKSELTAQFVRLKELRVLPIHTDIAAPIDYFEAYGHDLRTDDQVPERIVSCLYSSAYDSGAVTILKKTVSDTIAKLHAIAQIKNTISTSATSALAPVTIEDKAAAIGRCKESIHERQAILAKKRTFSDSILSNLITKIINWATRKSLSDAQLVKKIEQVPLTPTFIASTPSTPPAPRLV